MRRNPDKSATFPKCSPLSQILGRSSMVGGQHKYKQAAGAQGSPTSPDVSVRKGGAYRAAVLANKEEFYVAPQTLVPPSPANWC